MFRWLLGFSLLCVSATVSAHYHSVESIQERNIEILEETLPQGWKAFCDAPVDEGIMSLHRDINPSDATIQLLTITNQSVVLPIKSLSEIGDYDVRRNRRTLVYVNGYYTSDSYFSVHEHLQLLLGRRRDLNVIIVDFAKSIQQLYYAVRHHAEVQGYFVAKVLTTLIERGIQPANITVAGHSVGANIAALGARLYGDSTHAHGRKVGQLIAIDPALMCQSGDVYVRRNVADRVVVVHGEGDVFGVRDPCGTIDVYPNGIGYFTRRKMQPGCDTNLCSHMYSFILFMETLVEGVMIPAVKCDSWMHFRKGVCNYGDKIAIGLTYPKKAKGVYFCVTQPNPPFTYMEYGLKYKKTTTTMS